ncbi:GNAT family N-acetyltransferase [Lampropedia aestuarii]|uniref:GNAT family N-acetyltransferase n=1 Tax=Lampropedia aestuarii TaxID=2562762 RepID=UPI00246972E6|nr:GNAT family N-acetyltransferase [Lampropedia aestuarii]MDH5859141.1 GNAT family N-acetyltransferase [Lampropedia aestuarii]
MSTLFTPNIHTARLILRPLTPQDAPALLAIFSDPQVMRYWNTGPWSDLNTAQDFINSSAQAMDKQESLTLGIVRKDSAELIGKCMLFSYAATSKRAEIGFAIGAAHWGLGFVPEASQALLNYGFDSLRLRRIEAEIDPDNVASGKTLERLGFAKEGYLRQRWEVNGVVSDSALYGMLASDRTASMP